MAPTHADYAKINIGCKELGLDKYQLIGDRYGIESSKQLSHFQLTDLYAHFKKLGWVPKRSATKDKDLSVTYKEPRHRKVQAMWITLGKEGIVRKRGDHAMNVFVKNQTGKDNLTWCTPQDVRNLIEALKAMDKRGKAKHGSKKR
jgi:hypothetical protein